MKVAIKNKNGEYKELKEGKGYIVQDNSIKIDDKVVLEKKSILLVEHK